MPDIRSFFGPKGGGGGAPPKPAPKKAEEDSSKKRTKGRKVIDDSDDDDDDAVVETAKKPTKKPTPKKKTDADGADGVETTASDYFASSKSKSQSTVTADPKTSANIKLEVRQSPRNKKTAAKPESTPTKNGKSTSRQQSAATYKKHDADEDEDAFVEDDDADGGDDIFAADARGRNKRKNDDYVEEESEDEFLPKPKRIASRGKASATADNQDDKKPAASKSAKGGKAATPIKKTTAKKRKSPEAESDEDDDEDEDDEPTSRKKPAAKKPKAPKTKKADAPENTAIQAIFDDIPTVRPPTPPPKDPNAKFDWRKAAQGGGNSGPPPNPTTDELPEGEEDCLAGLTFVFTGQLATVSREDAQALVKRYGGKITGAPSSKTSFVVLGDDAGPSKLQKIKDHGIKTINEQGLFDLIRRLPAGGGSGKGAEKLRQKRKEEDEKIKQQALEMEKEEKARKAEAEKTRQAAVARGAAAAAPPPTAPTQLWTVKYAPTQPSHICGNKAAVERIQNWLRGWPKAKKYDFQKRGADGMGGERAIIISGPPGVGKTTAAHLAAKLEGYDILESNASDTRSKKLVEAGLSDVMNNTSLAGFFAGDGKKVDTTKKKMVLIMDEVDGMSAGDRGGVGALAKFCKRTEVPLILICNERRLPKMKPFDFVTYDVKFQRPTIDQIRSRMMTVCHREGLKLTPQVLDALIEGSNRDIRQIINMLSTIKLDQTSMDYDQSKNMSKAWEKSIVLKPWDICQKMLGGGLFSPASKSTLNEKIELYFNDHEFSFLMIQENYLRTKPMALNAQPYNKREQNLKALELVDMAAESISDGDLVDRMIHGPQQHWSLMPTHAVFSTVRPSSYVAGQLMGSNFTSWLGNNSKLGKLGRYIREIHSHMRLKSSGDHNEIRQQYLPVLWTQLIKKLEVEGKESVGDVIELMDSYFLTRDDWDAIKELGVGYQTEESISIDSQTKSTFTRMYNSMSHPVPFMKASNVGAAPKVAAKEVPDLEEAIEESGDDAEVVEAAEVVDEESDIKADKYIKKPKAKPAKKATKKAAKAADEDEEEEDEKPKKGKGKAAGKTKGKK